MIWLTGLRTLGRAVLATGLLAVTPLPSHAYSALYVFGDSLSDVGNLRIRSRGVFANPPYDDGRFSNGPVWVEDLASDLKLGSLTPSLSKGGGNDYAFASATASKSVPGSHAVVPNVGQQVDTYLVEHSFHADRDALYTMWIGSNDIIDALNDIAANTLTLAQAQVDLASAAQDEVDDLVKLVGLGARHLLVGKVPDLGVIPLTTLFDNDSATASALSTYYNTRLIADLTHSGINLVSTLSIFDPFTLLDDATENPQDYGLTNATNNCYQGRFTGGPGQVCSDPGSYLFWDKLHPTTVGHGFVAKVAEQALLNGTVSVVPLPASAPLFGAALLLLGAFGACLRLRPMSSRLDSDEDFVSRETSGRLEASDQR